jgi:hypothetical protein
MGEEGKRRMDERFSSEAMVTQIDRLYRELLRETPGVDTKVIKA